MAPILTFAMTAAITPGPNNIILSTNAVNFGFRKTIPLILGVFFGFLSVLTLCLLGIGEIYKSFPAIAMILKIIAVLFLSYLSFKIFTSSSFSDEKNSKNFSKNRRRLTSSSSEEVFGHARIHHPQDSRRR